MTAKSMKLNTVIGTIGQLKAALHLQLLRSTLIIKLAKGCGLKVF
jgi:hypothetical protein